MKAELTTISAFVVSWATVPLARRIGRLVGAIDQPNPDVRTHTEQVPLLGGVPIILGTWLTLLLVVPGEISLDRVLPVCLLCGLGGYKDISRRDVSPWIQLIFQFVACWLVVRTHDQWTIPEQLGLVICGIALINAVNFIDVMDGLCSMIAGIISVALFLITRQINALALAAACCGFWMWNRPKAKIFMGDIGSFFIGLSLFSLFVAKSSASKWQLVILLAVPAAEFCGTLAIRFRRSRALTKGDASHPSLCLLNAGYSTPTVLAIYGTCTIATCVIGWFIT